MQITSSAIDSKEFILEKYTCQGENVNPPLTFSEIPEGAKSLVLIMDDPDAPSGTYVHWILYNMSPATIQVNENALPPASLEGLTTKGDKGYKGPCPPEGQTHHYYFKLYALNKELDLKEGVSIDEINEAIEDSVIEQCEIIGLYKKN
jgi:Raf kinase inhibitor-like YbhB/YbcL family protein